jgi:hypothetical protein
MIASVRFSRPIDGTWEVPELSGMIHSFPGDVDRVLFVGRSVVHGDYRNLGLNALLLHHSCSWLVRHTSFTSYIGICAPKLLPFYEAMGARMLIPEEIRLHSRQGNPYRVMYADLGHTANTYRQHAETKGWCFLPPSGTTELHAIIPRKVPEK